MRKTWIRLAVVPVALAMLAAACSTSDDDDSSATQAPAASGATTTAAESTETTASGDTEATESTDASATTAAGATTTSSGATTTLPPTPGPGSAGSVTVFGVEDSENEAGAEQDALTEFGKANGIDITYVGRRDFEQQAGHCRQLRARRQAPPRVSRGNRRIRDRRHGRTIVARLTDVTPRVSASSRQTGGDASEVAHRSRAG